MLMSSCSPIARARDILKDITHIIKFSSDGISFKVSWIATMLDWVIRFKTVHVFLNSFIHCADTTDYTTVVPHFSSA